MALSTGQDQRAAAPEAVRAGRRRIVSDHALALWLLAGVMAFWCVGMAVALSQSRLPAAESGTVMVVFPPTYSEQQALGAIIRADGLLVRNSWFANVWVVHADRPGFVGRLSDAGAWGSFQVGSFQPVVIKGCFL